VWLLVNLVKLWRWSSTCGQWRIQRRRV